MTTWTWMQRALLVVPTALLGGCATGPQGTAPVERSIAAYSAQLTASDAPLVSVVVPNGARLEGRIECAEWIVPEGITAVVVGDLEVVAERAIHVRGTLIVADKHSAPLSREELIAAWEAERSKRAPSYGVPRGSLPRDLGASPQLRGHTVALEAGSEVRVSGEIRGGAGVSPRSWPEELAFGLPGGRGSAVVLVAPFVATSGVVRSGAGGDAAIGGDGGSGGDVWIYDGDAPRSGDAVATGGPGRLVMGAGGRGAAARAPALNSHPLPPGRGGSGGSSHLLGHEKWMGVDEWHWALLEPRHQ